MLNIWNALLCLKPMYFLMAKLLINVCLFLPFLQLLALVLISFGIYVVVSYDLNEIGALSSYAYVGLGVAALVLVLWGYLSAWRENVCCTVTVSRRLAHIDYKFTFVAIMLFACSSLCSCASSSLPSSPLSTCCLPRIRRWPPTWRTLWKPPGRRS